MNGSQQFLTQNVKEAADDRIAKVFDDFTRIYVSFSGGKDSTTMLHMVALEARRRGRKIGVLFVDLEGQYRITIEHIEQMRDLYSDCTQWFWVALPLNLRNAVSMFEPQWMCWDPTCKEKWVRLPPSHAITKEDYFPFFHRGMEFEELVPEFGKWYAQDKLCACFVGIRTDESLNRWRTIVQSKKQRFDGLAWTTRVVETVYNIYPIYDWRTRDIWIYHGKTKLPHNPLYDLMHKAGLTIHQMRICQPYGDDQRKGLWLFHLIEPETWGRIVARVQGANQGALYVQEAGNVLGNYKITKPPCHTWESFAMLLLNSMPPATAEHYKDKIAVFLKWYQIRGYPNGIPDDGPMCDKKIPSWTRICHSLLRNDYWCKGLSFSQHKSQAYEKYQKLMKRRRSQWNLI